MKIDDIIVLIVDDDPWMVKVLHKIIKSFGIDNVFGAHNGYDAVATAIKENVNLIFLDIMMPEIDGFQTLAMLKTIHLTMDANIVMVTGNTDIHNFGKAVKLGAIDYIAKPFTPEIIQKKILELFPGAL